MFGWLHTYLFERKMRSSKFLARVGDVAEQFGITNYTTYNEENIRFRGVVIHVDVPEFRRILEQYKPHEFFTEYERLQDGGGTHGGFYLLAAPDIRIGGKGYILADGHLGILWVFDPLKYKRVDFSGSPKWGLYDWCKYSRSEP